MKRKELTKTFMMILSWKKHFDLLVDIKYFSTFRVKYSFADAIFNLNKNKMMNSVISRAANTNFDKFKFKFSLFILNLLSAELCLCKPWRPKGFFNLKSSKNILGLSFRFISIPMFWVRCQNLTTADVRFWHLKSIPALKGLDKVYIFLMIIGHCTCLISVLLSGKFSQRNKKKTVTFASSAANESFRRNIAIHFFCWCITWQYDRNLKL